MFFFNYQFFKKILIHQGSSSFYCNFLLVLAQTSKSWLWYGLICRNNRGGGGQGGTGLKTCFHLSNIMKKPVFGGKQLCTTPPQKLLSDIVFAETLVIILSKQQTTKALIRLCTSSSLLLEYSIRQVLSWRHSIVIECSLLLASV